MNILLGLPSYCKMKKLMIVSACLVLVPPFLITQWLVFAVLLGLCLLLLPAIYAPDGQFYPFFKLFFLSL